MWGARQEAVGMQGIQRTFQSIAANLRGLTPAARLLVGSLMIIALMSLFLVSLYAGRTELMRLGLRHDVSDSVKAQVIDYLETRGVPYEARGDDLYIDPSRKFEVLGQLADQQLIGGDQINFDTLIADSSPFRTREENRQRYLVAKMNVLSGMIAQMGGIERARVVIDAPENAGGIGRPNVPPSASVSVQTRGGELSQAQVDAIAHLVARSHAGLKPENVAIIDARSGRGLQARNDEMTALGRYLELRQAAERHTRNALAGALDFIPGVLIEVNAQVNAADEVRQTSTMTDPASGVTDGALRLVDSPIASQDSERLPFIDIGSLGSRSIESSGPILNRSESQIRDPKGYPLRINASIGVPRSYFLRLLREQTQPVTTEANPAAFDAMVRAECDRLREYITPLIDTQAIEGATSGAIMVTMVHDFAPAVVDQPSIAPASASIMAGGLNRDLMKQVGLGALALLALAMMLLLFRRTSMTPPVTTSGRGPALASAEIELAAGEPACVPAFDRLELADEATRRQQMLRDVRSMIHDAPEATAESLRQWVRS